MTSMTKRRGTSRRRRALLPAVLLAAFAINLDTTMVNVALPSLATRLSASTSQLQWVVDAYNLAFAALLLSFGTLSDRLGRKGVMLTGLVVFGAASVAGGATTSVDALIAGRAVMGVGAAMTFPSTLSILRNEFGSRRELSRAVGGWGAVTGMAIALGPIAGGWLVERYAWSSVFTAMGPVAAVALLAAALVVPTSRDPNPGRLDVAGLAMSSAAVATAVYTIIEAPGRGWASAATSTGWAAAVGLLAAFLLGEPRTDHPMLDVALFRSPRFSAASAAVTVAFFTLFGFIFLMTQYLQLVRQYSPVGTGVRLLPVAVSFAVGSVLGNRLALRAGTKLVVAAGLGLIAAFYIWVAVSAAPDLAYGVIATQMAVFGLGLGATAAPAPESILGAVPAAKAGVSSAVNDTTRLLGGTLGVAVIGSIAATAFTDQLNPTLSAATASLPADARDAAVSLAGSGLGGALTVAEHLRATAPTAATHLNDTAILAFVHALSLGSWVAAGIAAVGAVTALMALPSRPATASPADDHAGHDTEDHADHDDSIRPSSPADEPAPSPLSL